MSTPSSDERVLRGSDPTTGLPGQNPGWLEEMRRLNFEYGEHHGGLAASLDLSFVCYLLSLARFGFFTFGPVTIDVRLVEDLFQRSIEPASGSETPPATDDYVQFSRQLMQEVRRSGRDRIDELHYLLAFMRMQAGLPGRVFGELGVTPEEVERYAVGLSTGGQAPSGPERLYSTEEAADYYGVHVQTVRSWIRSGRLPASRLAGQKSLRIRESDLGTVLEPSDGTD